jgi:hypothetical protein
LFRPGPKTLRYLTPVLDRGQLLSHVVRARALRIRLQEDCKMELKTVKEPVLNTDSDLMANIYIVLNCRRKLLEHAYGYYGMELKLAFSSL